MLKLPKRLPYELAMCGALLMGSCTAAEDRSHPFTVADYDRLDDADTNARNALEKTEDLETRLKAVEEKLGVEE